MGLATAASIIAATVAIHFAISEKIIPIAVDSHGVVTPMVPLNEATLTESRVIGFTEECVRRAFSHDFLHYDQTIPLAENCFTQRAAKNYVEAMQPYIKLMEQERMVMAVSVPNPPRVIRAYTEDTGGGPVALWDLQVMIDLSFEGRDKRIPPTRSRLDITIRRVPLENTPSGILIDKFGVAPA